MRTKTHIHLIKTDGNTHEIALNYDDATVEAITQAVLDLVHMHRMAEGDTLCVGTIQVED